MNEIIRLEPRAVTAADFAARITTTYRRSAEAIIETGRLIAEAKLALDHGEFLAMCESNLPFAARTAQRLMALASDERLANATTLSHLPPDRATLYELHRLSDEKLNAFISDGTINPGMDRKDIATTVKRERRRAREIQTGHRIMALPQKKYGVIYADPEWRFQPWSEETGMDRSADNHYRTSLAEQIAARDVPSIAAADCVLFLWATAPMLVQALSVMGCWGFGYATHVVWCKDRIGTGYWVRGQHELMLIGTKGHVDCPAPGDQFTSVIDAKRGAHSAKPEVVLEMIERMFPTYPKVELNRRGPARPGWDAWGDEVEGSEAA